jgi:hypothetical protein
MSFSVRSLAALAALAALAVAGSASAAVTAYTSQSDFDTANPTASTFVFDAGGATYNPPNPYTYNGVTFADEETAADVANGNSPLLFVISHTTNTAYGTDFLSLENESIGVQTQFETAGVSAFGFSYGAFVTDADSADAVVTLNTGESFLITPSSTPGFIGFSDSSPITSLSISYPTGYGLDVLSVSTTSAAPEPAAWALMLLGIGGVGLALRRHRKGAQGLSASIA